MYLALLMVIAGLLGYILGRGNAVERFSQWVASLRKDEQ